MVKNSRKNEILDMIGNFKTFIGTNEMAKIIKDELKKRDINSLPCYAIGGFHDSIFDNFVKETTFLRIGLKNAKGLLHHGSSEEEILCAIGLADGSYEPYKRLVIAFDKLPFSVQIEIFRTCLEKKFKYPSYGCIPNKKFSKNNADFNKLKPTFDKCLFADYDNSLYEIKFSGNWDENGRPIFTFTDGEGEERKVRFPEAAIYRISHGGVEQWGFDYAFSLDKEKLRNICHGCFKKDYTLND